MNNSLLRLQLMEISKKTCLASAASPVQMFGVWIATEEVIIFCRHSMASKTPLKLHLICVIVMSFDLLPFPYGESP